jgi:hypothetical protein
MPETLNALGNAVGDRWFGWLAPLPWVLQLALTALPLALLVLTSFRFASHQVGIREAQDRMVAYLQELLLFGDSARVLWRAPAQVALHALAWLGYALPALLLMALPTLLVLAQVEAHFAWRALSPGEEAIVAAQFRADDPPAAAALTGSGAVTVVTPPLHAGAQALWRVRAVAPGPAAVQLSLGDGRVLDTPVHVATRTALAPQRFAPGDWRALLQPAGAPLPAGLPVTALALDYPRARAAWLGLSAAGWAVIGATLGIALLLAPRWRVRF